MKIRLSLGKISLSLNKIFSSATTSQQYFLPVLFMPMVNHAKLGFTGTPARRLVAYHILLPKILM
nr:MAG TPA: hypothetical protein [Caudoviricetes sp.]